MAERIPMVVVTCDGCGGCCETIGSPPFPFLPPSLTTGEFPDSWGDDDPDKPLWDTMPAEALAILEDYYTNDPNLDRYERGLPCLWYDSEAKRCRFYEHRPTVCRDFPKGGADCREFRQQKGLPVWHHDEDAGG